MGELGWISRCFRYSRDHPEALNGYCEGHRYSRGTLGIFMRYSMQYRGVLWGPHGGYSHVVNRTCTLSRGRETYRLIYAPICRFISICRCSYLRPSLYPLSDIRARTSLDICVYTYIHISLSAYLSIVGHTRTHTPRGTAAALRYVCGSACATPCVCVPLNRPFCRFEV